MPAASWRDEAGADHEAAGSRPLRRRDLFDGGKQQLTDAHGASRSCVDDESLWYQRRPRGYARNGSPSPRGAISRPVRPFARRCRTRSSGAGVSSRNPSAGKEAASACGTTK